MKIRGRSFGNLHTYSRYQRGISLLLSSVFFITTVLSSFPAHAWNIFEWGEAPGTTQQPQEDPYEDVQRVGEAYLKTLPEDSAYRSMVGSTFVLPYKSHTNVLSSSELTQEFDRVSDLETSKKELALQSTKIYLNQALFNMMILEHTFGLRSQVAMYSKVPVIKDLITPVQTLWTQEKKNYPQASDAKAFEAHVTQFNAWVGGINEMCSNANSIYVELMKAYNSKVLQDPEWNPKIKDLLGQEENKGYYVIEAGGTQGIIRKRLKQLRAQATLEAGIYQTMMSQTMFGKLYSTDTQLRNYVGSFNTLSCVEYGNQLKTIPTTNKVWSILNPSIEQTRAKYQETITDLSNKSHEDATDVLKQYMEENPATIQEALIANPNKDHALIVAGLIANMKRNGEIKEGVLSILVPITAIATMGASLAIEGTAATIMTLSAIALNGYFVVSTIMDLSVSYDMEKRIEQGILSDQINPLVGQDMLENIKSSRPFSYVNLVLSGLGLAAASARAIQIAQRVNTFKQFNASQGGSTAERFVASEQNFFKLRVREFKPLTKVEMKELAQKIKLTANERPGMNIGKPTQPTTSTPKTPGSGPALGGSSGDVDKLLNWISKNTEGGTTTPKTPTNNGGGVGVLTKPVVKPSVQTVSKSTTTNLSTTPKVTNLSPLKPTMEGVPYIGDPIPEPIFPYIPLVPLQPDGDPEQVATQDHNLFPIPYAVPKNLQTGQGTFNDIGDPIESDRSHYYPIESPRHERFEKMLNSGMYEPEFLSELCRAYHMGSGARSQRAGQILDKAGMKDKCAEILSGIPYSTGFSLPMGRAIDPDHRELSDLEEDVRLEKAIKILVTHGAYTPELKYEFFKLLDQTADQKLQAAARSIIEKYNVDRVETIPSYEFLINRMEQDSKTIEYIKNNSAKIGENKLNHIVGVLKGIEKFEFTDEGLIRNLTMLDNDLGLLARAWYAWHLELPIIRPYNSISPMDDLRKPAIQRMAEFDDAMGVQARIWNIYDRKYHREKEKQTYGVDPKELYLFLYRSTLMTRREVDNFYTDLALTEKLSKWIDVIKNIHFIDEHDLHEFERFCTYIHQIPDGSMSKEELIKQIQIYLQIDREMDLLSAEKYADKIYDYIAAFPRSTTGIVNNVLSQLLFEAKQIKFDQAAQYFSSFSGGVNVEKYEAFNAFIKVFFPNGGYFLSRVQIVMDPNTQLLNAQLSKVILDLENSDLNSTINKKLIERLKELNVSIRKLKAFEIENLMLTLLLRVHQLNAQYPQDKAGIEKRLDAVIMFLNLYYPQIPHSVVKDAVRSLAQTGVLGDEQLPGNFQNLFPALAGPSSTPQVPYAHVSTTVGVQNIIINKPTVTVKNIGDPLTANEQVVFDEVVNSKLSLKNIKDLPVHKKEWSANTHKWKSPKGETVYFVTDDNGNQQNSGVMLEYGMYQIDQKIFKRYPESVLLEIDGEKVFVIKRKEPELKFNLTTADQSFLNLSLFELREKALNIIRKNYVIGTKRYDMMVRNDVVQSGIPSAILLEDLLVGYSQRNLYQGIFITDCSPASAIINLTMDDLPYSINNSGCQVGIYNGQNVFTFRLETYLQDSYERLMSTFLGRYNYDHHTKSKNLDEKSDSENKKSKPLEIIKQAIKENMGLIQMLEGWTEVQIRSDMSPLLTPTQLDILLSNRQTLLNLSNEVAAPSLTGNQSAIVTANRQTLIQQNSKENTQKFQEEMLNEHANYFIQLLDSVGITVPAPLINDRYINTFKQLFSGLDKEQLKTLLSVLINDYRIKNILNSVGAGEIEKTRKLILEAFHDVDPNFSPEWIKYKSDLVLRLQNVAITPYSNSSVNQSWQQNLLNLSNQIPYASSDFRTKRPMLSYPNINGKEYVDGESLGRVLFLTEDEYRLKVANESFTPADFVIVDRFPVDVKEVPLAGIISESNVPGGAHQISMMKKMGHPFIYWPNAKQEGFLVKLKEDHGLHHFSYSSDNLTISDELSPAEVKSLSAKLGHSLKQDELDLKSKEMKKINKSSEEIDYFPKNKYGLKLSNLQSVLNLAPDDTVGLSFNYFETFLRKSEKIKKIKSEAKEIETQNLKPDEISKRLEKIRTDILNTEFDPKLLEEIFIYLEASLIDVYGNLRIRDSNDISDDMGSGTYDSFRLESLPSRDRETRKRQIAETLKKIYASLYTKSAYDLRRYYGLDELKVSMAIMIHHSYDDGAYHAVSEMMITKFGSIELDVYLQPGRDVATNPMHISQSERIHMVGYPNGKIDITFFDYLEREINSSRYMSEEQAREFYQKLLEKALYKSKTYSDPLLQDNKVVYEITTKSLTSPTDIVILQANFEHMPAPVKTSSGYSPEILPELLTKVENDSYNHEAKIAHLVKKLREIDVIPFSEYVFKYGKKDHVDQVPFLTIIVDGEPYIFTCSVYHRDSIAKISKNLSEILYSSKNDKKEKIITSFEIDAFGRMTLRYVQSNSGIRIFNIEARDSIISNDESNSGILSTNCNNPESKQKTFYAISRQPYLDFDPDATVSNRQSINVPWIEPFKEFIQNTQRSIDVPAIKNVGEIKNANEQRILDDVINEKLSYDQIHSFPCPSNGFTDQVNVWKTNTGRTYYIKTGDFSTIIDGKDAPRLEYGVYKYYEYFYPGSYAPSILIKLDGKDVFISQGIDEPRFDFVDQYGIKHKNFSKEDAKNTNRSEKGFFNYNLPSKFIISDLLIGFDRRYLDYNVQITGQDFPDLVETQKAPYTFSKPVTDKNIRLIDGNDAFVFNLQRALENSTQLRDFINQYFYQNPQIDDPRKYLYENIIIQNPDFTSRLANATEDQLMEEFGKYFSIGAWSVFRMNRNDILKFIEQNKSQIKSSSTVTQPDKSITSFKPVDREIYKINQELKEGGEIGAKQEKWIQDHMDPDDDVYRQLKSYTFPFLSNPQNLNSETLGQYTTIQWIAKYASENNPDKKMAQDWLDYRRKIQDEAKTKLLGFVQEFKRSDKNEFTVTIDGREVDVEITNKNVRIIENQKNADGSGIRYDFEFLYHPDLKKQGVVHLNNIFLLTSNGDHINHSKLFNGSDLIDFMFYFVETVQGYPIREINEFWQDFPVGDPIRSRMFHEFKNYEKKFGKYKAAESTWSGSLYNRRGFVASEVDDTSRSDEVNATFVRDQKLIQQSKLEQHVNFFLQLLNSIGISSSIPKPNDQFVQTFSKLLSGLNTGHLRTIAMVFQFNSSQAQEFMNAFENGSVDQVKQIIKNTMHVKDAASFNPVTKMEKDEILARIETSTYNPYQIYPTMLDWNLPPSSVETKLLSKSFDTKGGTHINPKEINQMNFRDAYLSKVYPIMEEFLAPNEPMHVAIQKDFFEFVPETPEKYQQELKMIFTDQNITQDDLLAIAYEPSFIIQYFYEGPRRMIHGVDSGAFQSMGHDIRHAYYNQDFYTDVYRKLELFYHQDTGLMNDEFAKVLMKNRSSAEISERIFKRFLFQQHLYSKIASFQNEKLFEAFKNVWFITHEAHDIKPIVTSAQYPIFTFWTMSVLLSVNDKLWDEIIDFIQLKSSQNDWGSTKPSKEDYLKVVRIIREEAQKYRGLMDDDFNVPPFVPRVVPVMPNTLTVSGTSAVNPKSKSVDQNKKPDLKSLGVEGAKLKGIYKNELAKLENTLQAAIGNQFSFTLSKELFFAWFKGDIDIFSYTQLSQKLKDAKTDGERKVICESIYSKLSNVDEYKKLAIAYYADQNELKKTYSDILTQRPVYQQFARDEKRLITNLKKLFESQGFVAEIVTDGWIDLLNVTPTKNAKIYSVLEKYYPGELKKWIDKIVIQINPAHLALGEALYPQTLVIDCGSNMSDILSGKLNKILKHEIRHLFVFLKNLSGVNSIYYQEFKKEHLPLVDDVGYQHIYDASELLAFGESAKLSPKEYIDSVKSILVQTLKETSYLTKQKENNVIDVGEFENGLFNVRIHYKYNGVDKIYSTKIYTDLTNQEQVKKYVYGSLTRLNHIAYEALIDATKFSLLSIFDQNRYLKELTTRLYNLFKNDAIFPDTVPQKQDNAYWAYVTQP